MDLSIHTDPRVAELPSPEMDLSERGPWLRQILGGTWAESGDTIQHWRETIIASLKSRRETQIVFSHFVVINAVVSHILGNDKILSFYPDNASITHLQLIQGDLKLVSLGNESKTIIN